MTSVSNDAFTMRILHVNTSDKGGGAEKIAYDLFCQANENTYRSILAVGKKNIEDPNIVEIQNDKFRNFWAGFWRNYQKKYSNRELNKLSRLAGWMANISEPRRWLSWHLGYEDFNYPGIYHLIDNLPFIPDIIHLHNLHGNFFDLRIIDQLSQQFKVFLTLHDEWMYTGHCAYTFDCQNWKSGCGNCRYLKTYPALKADGTARNIAYKSQLYERSKLHVAASSKWLIDRALNSVLRPSIVESRVIRYGIDLEIFKPANKTDVRRELDIPVNATVVLFVANKAITNPYKDYSTIALAINEVANTHLEQLIYCISIGEAAAEKRVGQLVFKHIPYQSDPVAIAKFYQAADLYLHAAKVEAFGLVIAEAMACGVPVIATSVGGVPEVVKHGETGYLVSPGDSKLMARHVIDLINHQELRAQMSLNSYKNAIELYDRKRQFTEYVKWYREVMNTE